MQIADLILYFYAAFMDGGIEYHQYEDENISSMLKNIDSDYMLHISFGIFTYAIASIAVWKKSCALLRIFDLLLVIKTIFLLRIYLYYSFEYKDAFMSILIFGPDLIAFILSIVLDKQIKSKIFKINDKLVFN